MNQKKDCVNNADQWLKLAKLIWKSQVVILKVKVKQV